MSLINKYFKNSSNTILTLQDHSAEIDKICEMILDISKNNQKILVAGNGGSCSDAEHFTGELHVLTKVVIETNFSNFNWLFACCNYSVVKRLWFFDLL